MRNREGTTTTSSSKGGGTKNGSSSGGKGGEHKRKKTTYASQANEMYSVGKLLILFLACGFLVAEIQKKFLLDEDDINDDIVEELLIEEEIEKDIQKEQERLQLTIPAGDDFPTIGYALEHSDLVALYYSASWCLICQKVTSTLEEEFGASDNKDILIATTDAANTDSDKKRLSIVYVSSDKTQDEYNEHSSNKNWQMVPYNSNEQKLLKQHFKIWSQPELEELELKSEDRKYEIPSILVLSGKTQSIITVEGVDHVSDYGKNVLNFWEDLVEEEQKYELKKSG